MMNKFSIMNKFHGLAWLVALSSITTLSVFSSALFAQQSGVDESVEEMTEEVVTIGTRRKGRTALDTAVPIDVFNQAALDSVATDDMIDIIKTLVPSFSVERYPISDGATFTRPVKLRGLNGDQSLVLVNGKRRHRAALVRLNGFGSHAVDIATIPGVAVKSVEVLRDGAGAQYGSDAIAGVINFNLRDDAEGGEIRVQKGEYSQENESNYLVSMNTGFGLGQNGFVNISAELVDQDPTSRGQTYTNTLGSSGRFPFEAATDSQDTNGDGIPDRFGPDVYKEVDVNGDGIADTLILGSDGILDDTDRRYGNNLCFAEAFHGNCLAGVWGLPRRDSIRTFLNMGYDISTTMQLYGFGNYSNYDGDGSFFYRRPGVKELSPIRTSDGRIYNLRGDRYPAGFTPRGFANIIDQSITGGIRGEWDNGVSYDFSARWGNNEIRQSMQNSLNPSMGPASPDQFTLGNLINEETELNADFSKGLELGFASDLNVAFGFTYRDEGYDIEAGDPASYAVGPYAARDPWNFEITQTEVDADPSDALTQIECRIPGIEVVGQLCPTGDPINNVVPVGSSGFPGYDPNTSTSQYDRDSWAAYTDLEADITDRLLANIAFRYEDYSDFGDNFSWKAAGRFSLNNNWAVRGSVGTGFRAPTGGQISTSNLATRIDSFGDPVASGIFPASSAPAQVFGSVPLDAETSKQFTLGLTASPMENLTMTLDYYFIEVEDRIILSSNFTLGAAERAQLIVLGVPGANTISQVKFYNNDIKTETSGIDLVATYNLDWSGGETMFQLSSNWNKTEITDRPMRTNNLGKTFTFLNNESVFDTENGLPEQRANLTLSHTMLNDITFLARASYYGEYTQAATSSLATLQTFGAKTLVDLSATWDINDRYSVTIGADNVFDEFPDLPDFEATSGRIYRSDGPMSWQGSYYYLRAKIALD